MRKGSGARRGRRGGGQRRRGGPARDGGGGPDEGKGGEVVVPEGEDGDGDEVLEHPPQPPVLPLPEWLQKALGKGPLVCPSP